MGRAVVRTVLVGFAWPALSDRFSDAGPDASSSLEPTVPEGAGLADPPMNNNGGPGSAGCLNVGARRARPEADVYTDDAASSLIAAGQAGDGGDADEGGERGGAEPAENAPVTEPSVDEHVHEGGDEKTSSVEAGAHAATCDICWRMYAANSDERLALACGHAYHSYCLGRWMQERTAGSVSAGCLRCQKEITPQERRKAALASIRRDMQELPPVDQDADMFAFLGHVSRAVSGLLENVPGKTREWRIRGCEVTVLDAVLDAVEQLSTIHMLWSCWATGQQMDLLTLLDVTIPALLDAIKTPANDLPVDTVLRTVRRAGDVMAVMLKRTWSLAVQEKVVRVLCASVAYLLQATLQVTALLPIAHRAVVALDGLSLGGFASVRTALAEAIEPCLRAASFEMQLASTGPQITTTREW